MNKNSIIKEFLEEILNYATEGFGGLSSPEDLANEYKSSGSFKSLTEIVKSLIKWESAKSFSYGFLTNCGGLITVPITLAPAVAGSLLINLRLVLTIANLYGHDIRSERIQTIALLVLIGNSQKEILKNFGVELTKKLSWKVVQKIPGKVLVKINRTVGFRLVAKTGQKSVTILTKCIPFLGGLVGGSIDAIFCHAVGIRALKTFGREI